MNEYSYLTVETPEEFVVNTPLVSIEIDVPLITLHVPPRLVWVKVEESPKQRELTPSIAGPEELQLELLPVNEKLVSTPSRPLDVESIRLFSLELFEPTTP